MSWCGSSKRSHRGDDDDDDERPPPRQGKAKNPPAAALKTVVIEGAVAAQAPATQIAPAVVTKHPTSLRESLFPPSMGDLHERLARQGLEYALRHATEVFELVTDQNTGDRLPDNYRIQMAMSARAEYNAAISLMQDGLQRRSAQKQVELLTELIGDGVPAQQPSAASESV